MTLKPGTQVTINGQPATVLEFNYSTGRYLVRVHGANENCTVTKIDPPKVQHDCRRKQREETQSNLEDVE